MGIAAADGSARHAGSRALAALAVAVVLLLAVRLPFLPDTLDDLDAINFDLAVHDYDAAAHRPHPPGYPVFILLARIAHPLFASHAAGLGFVSALFGALAVVPLYVLVRRLTSPATAALACLFTLASPLAWFNSVRPMSDMLGLSAVLAAQALLLHGLTLHLRGDARGRTRWYLGVVAAGLAIGVRSQALFLVLPLLALGVLRERRLLTGTVVALVGTVAAWFVPVVALSGGLDTYLRSLRLLVATALPVEPLLSSPTPRRAAVALWDVLGAPWGPPWLAVPMLLMGAAGFVRLLLTNRAALGWALVLYLPYAAYHYLLQMTATIRYGLPVVPLIALLAAAAVTGWSRRFRLMPAAVAAAFVASASAATLPALAAYHAARSPASQALDGIRAYASTDSDFVVAGHHVFARYLARLSDEFTVLPSSPGRAWVPLVEYWKDDRREPILFLRDPDRTTLLLVGREARSTLGRWSWPSSVQRLLRGERPLSVELVRIDPPPWFAESGFLITREVGPPEDVARQLHRLHISPSGTRRALLVSGSVLGPEPAVVTLTVDERAVQEWHVRGAFTLRAMLDAPRAPGYVPVALDSTLPVVFTDVSVEPADRPSIRPATGFYYPEPNTRGGHFRWTAPNATAAAYVPAPGARLRVRGSIPIAYYEPPVRMTLRWDGLHLGDLRLTSRDFAFECELPVPRDGSPWGTLTLDTSQSFVPDERQGNGDRRVLAARIDELSIVPPPRTR